MILNQPWERGIKFKKMKKYSTKYNAAKSSAQQIANDIYENDEHVGVRFITSEEDFIIWNDGRVTPGNVID